MNGSNPAAPALDDWRGELRDMRRERMGALHKAKTEVEVLQRLVDRSPRLRAAAIERLLRDALDLLVQAIDGTPTTAKKNDR